MYLTLAVIILTAKHQANNVLNGADVTLFIFIGRSSSKGGIIISLYNDETCALSD